MYSQVKVILAIGLIKHHVVKAYGEVEVLFHTISLSVLEGGGVVSLMHWLLLLVPIVNEAEWAWDLIS